MNAYQIVEIFEYIKLLESSVEKLSLECDQWRARASDLAARVREEAGSRVRRLVAAQAEDDGLWFHARTAPESYLQAALRRLHAEIEA